MPSRDPSIGKAWRAANRERVNACERARYAKGREVRLAKYKAARIANPDKFKKRRRSLYVKKKSADPSHGRRSPAAWRKQRYGITEEQYNAMLKKQKNACAICQQPAKLHVDHCHETKIVRGLLCLTCNTALGKFKNSPELLQRAVEYVGSVQLIAQTML